MFVLNDNVISKQIFMTDCCKGAFTFYIDRRGWVGGQQNVYAYDVNDHFYSLDLSTKGEWVVKNAQKLIYVVIEWPLTIN